MHKQAPVITIRDLKKSYDQKKPVLKGVNLDVYPGQIIGYIGPNGAGKTTTVKILIGMLEDFTGLVRVLGHDITENPMQIKRKIGYIPEDTALYDSLTPLEYLSFVGQIYGLDESLIKKKVQEMLKIFNLDESINTRMTTFSKGMKQKVLIAAGMIHDPEIIFLDEPLSGLDANSTIIMKEILVGLAAQGKTIFYCSHIMDVVERISHRIVLIDNGQVITDRPFKELQSMSKEKSLEKIFTQLTGQKEFSLLAQQFISALKEK